MLLFLHRLTVMHIVLPPSFENGSHIIAATGWGTDVGVGEF